MVLSTPPITIYCIYSNIPQICICRLTFGGCRVIIMPYQATQHTATQEGSKVRADNLGSLYLENSIFTDFHFIAPTGNFPRKSVNPNGFFVNVLLNCRGRHSLPWKMNTVIVIPTKATAFRLLSTYVNSCFRVLGSFARLPISFVGSTKKTRKKLVHIQGLNRVKWELVAPGSR